jgi:GTPase SAR1 family protein
MLNICGNCGLYRPDKVIDLAGPYATCPECGHKHPFLRLPLLIVSGASGAGKSTVCHQLLGKLTDVVLLDSDILWRSEFATPGNTGPSFSETWLRVAKSVGQSGRPVVLFGAGVGVPDNIEPCVERRYFADVHYLALVCSDDSLIDRLQCRPEWRQTHSPQYVADQIRFNRWFKERRRDLRPAIELLDTTNSSILRTAEEVKTWITARIAGASQTPAQE